MHFVVGGCTSLQVIVDNPIYINKRSITISFFNFWAMFWSKAKQCFLKEYSMIYFCFGVDEIATCYQNLGWYC